MPDRHLHAPWEAPPEVLAAAGPVLGENYPAPMIDHGRARERARERCAPERVQANALSY